MGGLAMAVLVVLTGCPNQPALESTDTGTGDNTVAGLPRPATPPAEITNEPTWADTGEGNSAATAPAPAGSETVIPGGNGAEAGSAAPRPGSMGAERAAAEPPANSRGRRSGAAPGAASRNPVRLTGELAKIAEKRKAVTSYRLESSGGRFSGTRYVKLRDGKTIASRTEVGTSGDWTLAFPEKGEVYRYDAEQKTITRFRRPVSRDGAGGPGSEGESRRGPRTLGGAPAGTPAVQPGAGGPGAGRVNGQGGGRGGRGMGGLGAVGDLERFARPGVTPKITHEKLDGMDCWRIEVSGERGSSTTWMDKQYGLPRQASFGDMTLKFKVDQINKVPDSVFTLPKGVKVVDAPAGVGFGGRGGGMGAQGAASGGAEGAPPRRAPQ